MKDVLKVKQHLYQACLLFSNERRTTVQHIIKSYKKDLLSETKSSAGDKHETGRAMLQLEMEKASQQLAAIDQMKVVLDKMTTEIISEVVCLGSIAVTDKGNYYLAISAGKITIDTTDYFAISTNSPIGQQLLGKIVGDIISFNKAEILDIY